MDNLTKKALRVLAEVADTYLEEKLEARRRELGWHHATIEQCRYWSGGGDLEMKNLQDQKAQVRDLLYDHLSESEESNDDANPYS